MEDKTRVLVVDDEPSVRKSCDMVLSRAGYHVETAPGSHEALEMIERNLYDIIITDIRMPEINGIEFIKRMRESQPELDVMIMTGYPSIETTTDGMRLGTLDYLIKPFTPTELKECTTRVLEKRREKRLSALRLAKAIESEIPEKQEFLRFTLSQRVQHVVLLASFTLLAVTGLPLVFPQFPFVKSLIPNAAAFELRGILHRLAAIVLIGLSAFHFLYFLFSRDGRRDIIDLISRPRDLLDGIKSFMHNLGIVKDAPKFGRFNFIERMEYVAVLWGTVVMIATGLVLWFEVTAAIALPLWAIDVARVVHRYEAILAILSIGVWHLYNVHFSPEVFPMSRVWLTGKISRDEMVRHHPLEFERIQKKEAVERERLRRGVIGLGDDSATIS